jgi:hypothetical protein
VPNSLFLAALSAFIGLLAVGAVRRWRWTFWLILVAFLFGVLRVPAAVLQLTGILATNSPIWYVTFKRCLAWSSSASGWSWWSATAVPASGERTERSCDTGLIAPMGTRRASTKRSVVCRPGGLKHTAWPVKDHLLCLPGVVVAGGPGRRQRTVAV